ncbi:hypothetical protein MRX96_042341 [Rhipicephalus microplus]
MIDYLTATGVLELAACFVRGAALTLVGALLFVGVIAWIARRVHWRTYKHLKHLPHRKEQVPFQGLWIMFKASSPSDSPIGFSTLIFSAICGLHARFQRFGRHLVYAGFTPILTMYKAKYVEEILSSNKLLAKGTQYNLLHSWLGTGLLTSSGDKWRSRRRLFTPAVKPNFNIVPEVTLCTLDIICETIMGTSISAQSNENSPYVAAVNRLGELFFGENYEAFTALRLCIQLYSFWPGVQQMSQCASLIHPKGD